MKKEVVRRCLCVALASALAFADVGIVSAAEGYQDMTGIVSSETDADTAEIAESKASVSIFNMYEALERIYLNISANAYKAEVWVNGKKYTERTSSGDNQYIGIYKGIDALPGITYNVELRISNKDGEVITSRKNFTTSAVTLRRYTDEGEPEFTAESGNWGVDDIGMKKPGYVKLVAGINNPGNYKYKYEIYRSSTLNGEYSRIDYGYSTSNNVIRGTDFDVEAGKVYYYKMRILSGTDEYVSSDEVIAESPYAAGVRYGVPTCSISTNPYGVKNAVTGLYFSTDFANQFDIYRSTTRTKGYRKIATAYESYYEDKTAKKGTVYYYKAVPKYYDHNTGKTWTGKSSEPAAVRYLMDAVVPELTQVSATSMKCSWNGENSSDVSYEVWYKRTDVNGDAYRRAAVTKKSSFILKNLVSDGTYAVKIRTVKKAGSAVKYSYSNTSTRTMGYTESVQNLYSEAVKSAADTDKGVVAVYYKFTWSKDWGASGYYVKAYNNYTNKTETIKKLSSKAVSYTFRNVADTGRGLKYSSLQIVPYRGKTVGTASASYTDYMPEVSKAKVTRKSGTSVQISWTAVPGTKSYTIYRTTAFGATQNIGTSETTSFVDTHVTNGMRYSYQVVSTESIAGFDRGYGYTFTDYIHALTRPTISSGTNASAGTASLKWGKIANAKCYKVYRADTVNGKYVQVARTSQNVCVYADNKLKKGKTYYYRVVALTVNGCGRTVKSMPSAAKAVRINK